MKYSRIISTLFFLCAFFLISPVAEAIASSEDSPTYAVYRRVVAEGYLLNDEVVGYYATDFDAYDIDPYSNEAASYEYGNFEFKSYGGVKFRYYHQYYDVSNGEYYYDCYYEYNKKLTEAYQNSNIIIEDNKLVLGATGYSDNPYWSNDDEDYDGDAQSLIEIGFLIDQNYLLSLSGILYGYSTSWGESSSYFELYDYLNHNYIVNKSGSDSGTTLDQSLILPSGAYYLKINAYDGSFEDINLVLEPAASVPIPQSLWLLLSGSILTFLYVRRRVMV